MLKVKYFTGINLVDAAILPGYQSHLKNVAPQHYSVELIASGKMYFQHYPGERHVIDYPALRWQAPGNVYNYGPADENGWEHYFVLFDGERGRELYEQGFALLNELCFMRVERVEHYRNLFRTIHHIILHSGLDRSRAVFHLEELLLSAMEDAAGVKGFNKYLDEIKNICDRMCGNSDEDFDLRALASSMRVSYSHFRKLFIEYAGVPPHQYWLRARMRIAAERLQFTDIPLKEIGFELNLGNQMQFSRMFKNIYGVPPATFRNLSRGGTIIAPIQ